MRRLPLLLLTLCVLPGALPAQVAELRVEGAGTPASFAVARHRGHPAYPASALRALGAAVELGPAGGVAILFGDTLVFEARSPVFLADGRAQQLVAPAYREGGILYLPHQLFAEWLPRRFPDQLGFEDGVLRRIGEGAAVAGAAPAGPKAGSEPAPPAASGPPAARAGGSADRDPATQRVVIIDAGHGGRDPGKTGPNGLREKDVALAIARRLASVLRERGGYEVHLTRSTDTLIALSDRPHLANEWKAGRPAALFVSIHANAGPSAARGFETFFLSEARTEDERRVAEMENAAVQFEENRVAPAADDRDWILNHLRNDFYLRASNDLAEVVQRRLGAFHPGPDRGVKQASFVVLVGAFMPAVLVETAFISNRGEAALLAAVEFQRKVASALADAIVEFFASHEHLWVAEGGE